MKEIYPGPRSSAGESSAPRPERKTGHCAQPLWTRLTTAPVLQPKLTIGFPGDLFEAQDLFEQP